MQSSRSRSRILLKWLAGVVLCMSSLAQAGEAPRAAKSRSKPCQRQEPERTVWPQGTHLWGTWRQVEQEETSSVLTSVSLAPLQLTGGQKKQAHLDGGRLSVPGLTPQKLTGALLQGTSSDGKPVEVALCGVEPSPQDEKVVWYHVEIWNAVSESWENPCVTTSRVLHPRALAVPGVWGANGARQDVPGRFTFACENGAIAKCVNWGYKPWALKDGRPLTELHQACTRMARADYCGDGRSHTHQNTFIDMYDSLGLLAPTPQATEAWDPARASFEASWTAEGAQCMARTRDGRALESVLAECPGRFEPVAEELGQGDRCTHRRKGSDGKTVLLRNRSYH
jgi:hypothetical protein